MHTIRLRGPWKAEIEATSRDFDWEREIGGVLESTSGALILRRRFNRPTGLAAGDVVSLVIVGLPADHVRLNGKELALVAGKTRLSISEELQPSNLLEIQCSVNDRLSDAENGPLVQLEIVSAADPGTSR
jgi:hypothetical protein